MKVRVAMQVVACRLFLAALLTHAALVAWGDSVHSPMIDEVAYLAAGVSHWQFGRFDLCAVSPPLVRSIAAIPVLYAQPRTNWFLYQIGPGARPEHLVGRSFVVENGRNSLWLFTLARWAVLPLSVLGACGCYCWANALYGPRSALVAGILWCFCPNILANAEITTPDLGMAALAVWSGYFLWRWLRQPNWTSAIYAGIVLGFAQLAKTNVVVFLPLWVALWLIEQFIARRSRTLSGTLPQVGQLVFILALAIYVLNAGYLFQGSLQKLGDYRFVSRTFAGERADDTKPANRFADTWLAGLPVPLPRDYLTGIDLQKRDFENARGLYKSYLGGSLYPHGFWYFYLYALAVKLPIGTIALALAALGYRFLRRGPTPRLRDDVVVLAPAAALLVLASSQTGFSHHVRYVLGALPFLYVWISQAFQPRPDPERGHQRRPLFATACLAATVISSLWAYPHSLSYFNELAGGPAGGHRHLLESNLDWGQDLLYLKEWCDRHPQAQPLQVALFAGIEPSIAGIPVPQMLSSKSLFCFSNVPDSLEEQTNDSPNADAWYAISEEALYGGAFWQGPDCSAFRELDPVGHAGYTIHIYHVSAAVRRSMHR